MDISAKMTLSFDLKDTTTLIKEAVVKLARDKYGMSVKPNDIDVKFNSTTASADVMDRGPLRHVFSGVDVTIMQVVPLPNYMDR